MNKKLKLKLKLLIFVEKKKYIYIHSIELNYTLYYSNKMIE